MQRMPSSLRSKIQSGSEKRSSVSMAFIARFGAVAAAARHRPSSSGATLRLDGHLPAVRTERGLGSVLTGLRRASASSSRRLISSHCGLSPPSVRWSV